MKRSTFHLASAFCGVATGLLMGRLVTGPPNPASSSGMPAARERPDRRGHAAATDAAGKHDFTALLKMRQQGRLNDSPLVRDLERLSAGRLRELLLELREYPKRGDDAGNEARGVLIQTVAEELYRREGMDSLTWADTLEKGSFRNLLMWRLIGEAAFESPVRSKPWIDRFLSENGEDGLDTLRWKLMSGAQARGAEDVIQLEKLFGDHFSTLQNPAIPYPEGFDYHKLFTGIPPGNDASVSGSMFYWAKTDREAAWEGIVDTVELHGKNGALYYGVLFSGAGGLEDDPAARKWAVGKLDEIPDAFRADAVKSISNLGRLDPSTAATIMKDLPREADRVALVSAIITPYSNHEKLLPTIRALGSEGAIKAALLTAAHDCSVGGDSPESTNAKRTMETFAALMGDLDFSPESKAQVDAALRTKR